jgi:sugar phosphate permease
MAVGLVILGTGPSLVLAVIGAAILGFGFSFPWSSVGSVVLKRTPSREHGTAVGVLSAFYDLFVGVSSFTAGAVATHFGYSAAFYMAAVSLLVAGAFGLVVFRPSPEISTVRRDEYVEALEP